MFCYLAERRASAQVGVAAEKQRDGGLPHRPWSFGHLRILHLLREAGEIPRRTGVAEVNAAPPSVSICTSSSSSSWGFLSSFSLLFYYI